MKRLNLFLFFVTLLYDVTIGASIAGIDLKKKISGSKNTLHSTLKNIMFTIVEFKDDCTSESNDGSNSHTKSQSQAKGASKPNGSLCRLNQECASGFCSSEDSKCKNKGSNGDKCLGNLECKSNKCFFGFCFGNGSVHQEKEENVSASGTIALRPIVHPTKVV